MPGSWLQNLQDTLNINKQLIHNFARLQYSNMNRSCFGYPLCDLRQDRQLLGFDWSADQCCLSFHWTVVVDVLVANQLNLFIVFYKTYWQPERRPCPLVGAYMVPRANDKSFLIGGRISPISLARGMGPIQYLSAPPHTQGAHARACKTSVHIVQVMVKRNGITCLPVLFVAICCPRLRVNFNKSPCFMSHYFHGDITKAYVDVSMLRNAQIPLSVIRVSHHPAWQGLSMSRISLLSALEVYRRFAHPYLHVKPNIVPLTQGHITLFVQRVMIWLLNLNYTFNRKGYASNTGYQLKLHFQILCVFPVQLQIFPVPIYIICDHYIYKTDMADLSCFKKCGIF